MKGRLVKGTFGYLDKNKVREWKKAVLMLSIPIIIFIISWVINETRMNVMTVVAILGSLPGCNQVVRAIMATRYHSIEKELYEATEQARGDRLALYENVFTSYDANYYVDCMVISGSDVVGYTSVKDMNTNNAAAHLRKIFKDNGFKENVKIFTERKAFLDRVRTFAGNVPEELSFEEVEGYPGMTHDEVIQYLLMAISL